MGNKSAGFFSEEELRETKYSTVNIDIFAQQNFPASNPRRHIFIISAHIPFNSICAIMTHIFTYLRPKAKCVKICTVRKFLHLQYTDYVTCPRHLFPLKGTNTQNSVIWSQKN